MMRDMTTRTVDWTAPRSEAPTAEGLRERKKRLMRQQLTDAATEMFMQRGFDVAQAQVLEQKIHELLFADTVESEEAGTHG